MKTIAVFILAIAFIRTAIAGTESDKFGVKHWPVEPTLSINAEPDLCKEILLGARDTFASGFADLDYSTSAAGNWEVLTWNPAFDDLNEATTSFIGRLDLDLDGDGRKQVVIYRSFTHSWRGDWHYANIFPSNNEFNAVAETIKEKWVGLSGDSQYPDPSKLDLGARQYYPGALSISNDKVQTGNVWAEHALIPWRHKYYFFAGSTEFDRLRQTDLSLYHLHANGTVNEACRIDINGGKKLYAKFLATPGVSSLIKVIRNIGSGGDDCGTMHSGLQHDEQATAAERRAATRPWAVSLESKSVTSENPYYVFDDRTKKFLEYWSLEGLWTRREYQTFLEHIKPAEEGYATYLTNEFGVEPSKAKSNAAQVVQQLIGARFILPNSFDFTDRSRNLYFGEYSIGQALISRDWETINPILKNPESMSSYDVKTDSEVPFKVVLSKVLADAVEWPYVLDRLLKAGADPNQPNAFGKTPLMVASHFDRPDSVRMLLSAHAEVNAVTHNISGVCSNGFERVGRSALTYAAENASPVVIKLLLDAGAYPDIHDSKGNGLDYYLAKNPRLTGEEKKLGVTGLSKIASQFVGPSFNCLAARTRIEKLVCNSEVLRMFDQELARAYELFRLKQGVLAVADQRDWVKRKNASCTEVSLSEECLAEVMRTRIRYLHNRNSENLFTE